MTTAAAPDGQTTDAMIRATVRALASGKGWTVAQLGARVGIPTSSMYYKLSNGFLAAEVAELTSAFGVPTGCRPRHLSLVPQLSEVA